MKVKVLKSFRDSKDVEVNKLGRIYKASEVADFPKKKADKLIGLGLVKKVVTKKTEDKNAAPKLELKDLDIKE